jgi:hypothetical protein
MSGPAGANMSDATVGGFQFTDISGSASVRYLLDDRARASLGSAESFETQQNLEAELFLLTSSYLYHPDFLDMKIGGGPLLVTQDFGATLGDNSTNEALFNFVADLNFLSEKAYPIRTYYKLTHPSVSTSLSGRFLVRQNEYGLNAQLREQISPVQLTLDMFHIDTFGSGFGTTLDEDIDEQSLSAFKSYGKADRLAVTYRQNRRESVSGSPGLPLQRSIITTRTTDLDARNVFGADGKLELVQQIFLVDQDTQLDSLTSLKSRQYFGNLYWTHSKDTRSFYRYEQQANIRPGQSDVRHRSLVVGGTQQRGQNLILDADATVTNDRDVAFDRQMAGIRANFVYKIPTTFGSMSFGGGLGARRTDQVSDRDQAQAFDEPAILTGTDLINLRNDFVVSETVIVRNEPKTQDFVEGLDYRLVTVGSSTSIQRLVGGNIADGQTVLLEYSYLTGGTVEFDTLSQNVTADIRFLDYFSVYTRLSNRNNNVIGGAPVIPLNDARNMQFGGTIDYPIGDRWTVGGEYYRTDQSEEISSFVRNSYDVYVQMMLPLASSARLLLHKETIDNEGSIEDVDLVRYRLSLRSRPIRGIMLSWDSDYLEDNGGSLFRERLSHSLGVQWVYRQMRIIFRGEQTSETLGTTVRDNLRVTAQIQRAF